MRHWLFGGSLLVLTLVGFAGLGCSSRPEGSDAEESNLAEAPAIDELTELAELNKVLGDDRVARALRANPAGIPSQLPDFEQLMKVGRACNRIDSKEIFVIEEKNTRLGGTQSESDVLLPRVVIGGCNQNPGVAGSVRQSFELFVPIVSDKALPESDPLSFEPVESMALDQTTGLYNFYVLHKPEQPGQPGTVVRFSRNEAGEIQKFTKMAGKAATVEVSQNHECFNCHVNGGPIMNELTQPWTGWVSSAGQISRVYSGATREIVSESRPYAGEHTRSSLANALQDIVQSAIATWVEGLPERPGSGLGPQTLAGKQPGGVPALLRSVFCQTELNYATAFDTIPFPLFVDQMVADLASLERPLSLTSSRFPVHLPVRSFADQRIEIFLEKKGILSPDTVLAARVVDDENDVFSATRCALHADTVERMNAGATPDQAARAAILASLGDAKGPRPTFLRALLDPQSKTRDAAQKAYVADVAARYQAAVAKLDTPAGLQELQRRLDDRQLATQAMFDRPANPMPVMHPNPAPVASK